MNLKNKTKHITGSLSLSLPMGLIVHSEGLSLTMVMLLTFLSFLMVFTLSLLDEFMTLVKDVDREMYKKIHKSMKYQISLENVVTRHLIEHRKEVKDES